MPLLAIPNISEGRAPQRVAELVAASAAAGGRVLDVHQDEAHNRSVLTLTGTSPELVAAVTSVAVAASHIDLTQHEGAHPRLGGLDVCPFVPVDASMAEAVRGARAAGRAISRATGIPIYLYGAAAVREEARELPSIRRGGLAALEQRAAEGFPPDIGTPVIDRRRGVICVGARSTLIAFNVWLRCELEVARRVARRLRASSGGLPGVQALGLLIEPPDLCQVSMNLTEPETTGIARAFEATRALAAQHSASVLHGELIGLVPERYLPDPDATAARLLIRPGRSLEAALGS
jgi:glutamate formiminotransferase / 5-formyltetrahydrofolate cyclo-ligase